VWIDVLGNPFSACVHVPGKPNGLANNGGLEAMTNGVDVPAPIPSGLADE